MTAPAAPDPVPGVDPCPCGWTVTGSTTGHCYRCHEPVPGPELFVHLRLYHPDVFDGAAPLCWPDGHPVIIDTTLAPEDFL